VEEGGRRWRPATGAEVRNGGGLAGWVGRRSGANHGQGKKINGVCIGVTIEQVYSYFGNPGGSPVFFTTSNKLQNFLISGFQKIPKKYLEVGNVVLYEC
jgi:hypothetical protein